MTIVPPGRPGAICWVVTDGKPGMENQCLGLAEALGFQPVVKRVKLRAPWKQLSPHILRIGNALANTADSDPIAPPWPELLIATGRHSVASSLAVGKASPSTFRVQIQAPAMDPARFDLVVVPRHDRLRGPNVLPTKGALHRVTPDRLEADAAQWRERLAHLPSPRVAVLVGGNNGVYSLTPEITATLADRLAALCTAHGAGLMVTASRRTGAENEKVLRDKLAGLPAYVWDNQGPNPYFAFLGLADVIVATCDSVSMASEACSTGKPVYIVQMEGGSRKFDEFHRALREDGITRLFTGELDSWSYPPLDDTAVIAAEVRKRMAG